MAGPRMTAERAYELARAGVTPEQIGDVDIREQVYSVLNDPELTPAERLDAATALSQSEGAGGPKEKHYSDLKDISTQLAKASKLHKGQSVRLAKMSKSEGAGGPAKDELESTYRAPGVGQAAVGAVGVLSSMDKDDFAMGGPGDESLDSAISQEKQAFLSQLKASLQQSDTDFSESDIARAMDVVARSLMDASPPAAPPTVARRVPAVLPWDKPSGEGVYDPKSAFFQRQRALQEKAPVLEKEIVAKIRQYDAPLFEQMFGITDESESAALAALRGNPAYKRQFEDTIQMFKEAPDLPPLPDTPISEIAGADDISDSERASRLAAHEGLAFMHQKRNEIRRDIKSGEIGIAPMISDFTVPFDAPEMRVPTPEQRKTDDEKLEEAMWFETEGGRVLTGEEGEGGPEEDEAELQRVMEAMEGEEEPWYQAPKEWVEEQALQVGEGVRRTGQFVEEQAKEFAEDPGEYSAKKLWPPGRIAESIRRYQAGESLMEATDAEAMLIAADIVDPTVISQIAAASLYELEGDREAAAITLGAGLAGAGVGVLAAKLARMRRANKIALEARGVKGEAADEMTSRAIRDAHRKAAPSTYGPLKKFGSRPGGLTAHGEWEATRHLAKPQGRVVLPDGVEVQYWRHPDYPDQIIRERIHKPGEPMYRGQIFEVMPQGRWVDEAFGPGVRPLDLGDPDWPGMAPWNPGNLPGGLHKGRGDVPAPGRTRRAPEAGRDLSKVEARRAKVEALDQYKDIPPHGPIGGTRIRASTVAEFRDDLVVFSRGKDGTPSSYIHPENPNKVLVPGASEGTAWRVKPRPDRFDDLTPTDLDIPAPVRER